MWVAVAGVGLLVVFVILANLLGGDDVPAPAPTTAAPTGGEQPTLLIQVRNDDDLGADNVIAGVDGGLPAVQVLVPSRLLVDPPGSAPQTLAQSAGGLDRSASQNALRDLLALRIDGTLSLGRLALAGMVDFVGGITVDVDSTITTIDESTGQKVVVVPSGTQHLDGTQAAALALAWLPGEPESARLQRWSQVLTATVSALPDDTLRIEQMLTSLGGSARTTVSTSQVAAFLLRLRAGMLAGNQVVDELPTVGVNSPAGHATGSPSGAPSSPQATSPGASPQPTGRTANPTATATAGPSGPVASAPGQLALVRLDLSAAQELLERVLPTALLDAADAKPRVLLQDGVGEAGVVAAAGADLTRAGFVVVGAGNTADLGQATTRIIIGAGTAGADVGVEVAQALDVPAAQVETAADPVAGADAVVVLGADFEH